MTVRRRGRDAGLTGLFISAGVKVGIALVREFAPPLLDLLWKVSNERKTDSLVKGLKDLAEKFEQDKLENCVEYLACH